ncbi:hypothetical protein BGZ98_001026 [Dissophora globulifera]|nr:hypothetical protein BGZ98_001026 [Dissophora globulifera]
MSVAITRNAHDNIITFNVAGYPDIDSGSLGVSIDGQITQLAKNISSRPLWSGIVAGLIPSSAVSYNYVKLTNLGQAIVGEDFTRSFQDSNMIQTPYEVFDREVAKTRLPQVPFVYDLRRMSKTDIFDDTVVATFRLEGDSEQFMAMLSTSESTLPMKVDVRFINDKLIHNVNNVTFGIADVSHAEFKKQAFQLKFDMGGNQSFFSRPHIKLLSCSSDPTFVREKLFIDMLIAVDHSQGNSAINQGALWEMNAPTVENQGDLVYKGDSEGEYCSACYKMRSPGANSPTAPMVQLIQLMKDLADFDPANGDTINVWEDRIDLDGGKWQWIPTNSGGTFGDGDPTDTLTTYQSYADFRIHDRCLVSKLIREV